MLDQVLPTVSHELVHIFAVEDPEGFKSLSDLVFAGLKESTGHTRSYLISEEINRILETDKNLEKDKKRFEGKSEETRRAIAEEEIVARACEDRLANSRLAKEFIAEMENKESGLAQKFSNFLGEAIARLKKLFQQIFSTLSRTKEAQSLRKLTDSLEAIQSQYDALLERRTTEDTTAPSEQQKNTSDRGVMNAERESGEREFNQYASFEEQIKYIVAPENINKNIYQNLLIGRTPKVWREIGLSDLPVMMSVSHTRENYFPQSSQYPEGKGMGKKLYQLPEKIQDPIAIFASKTHPRDSVVALIELKDKNGKSVITPIEINGLSQNSGHLIDVNRIKTAFGKDNAWKLLRDAVNEEMLGGNTLFYWQKNKAISLAHASGVQFPTSVPNLDGFVHSISENKDLVNTKVLQQTETKQFKRWFGKSKVVNADGTPKVMYHGTRAENGEFYEFDESKAVKKGGLGLKALGKGNYFTAKKLDGTERYGSRVIEAYLTIKKPFVYEGGTSLLEQVGKEFGIRTEGMSYDELQKEMRNRDYDGVIQYDSNGEVSIAVTFDSNQIKSATDNIGTFDRSNPDIRYADRATYMTARELLLQAMAEVGKYLISY